MTKKGKFSIYTLGCKVNQYESERIKEELRRCGFLFSPETFNNDILIINTCSVTKEAESKSRQMIRRVRRYSPKAKIIITGCYVNTHPQEVQKINNGNYLILPNEEKENIARYVGNNHLSISNSFFRRDSSQSPSFLKSSLHTRALLKIQDGCSRFCSYCIIPQARPEVKSKSLKEVITEAKNLKDKGFKEIVLCGICLGAYGEDMKGDNPACVNLALLIDELIKISGLKRVRLSSIDLKDLTEDLMDRIITNSSMSLCGDAQAGICPHLHIPLQSGDDKILRAMRRRYTYQEFKEKVLYLKSKIPDLALTTDVIVGFPGETKENFMNTYNALKELKFAKVHIFKYADRPNTAAEKMKNKVEEKEKEKRSKEIFKLAERLSLEFKQNYKGREVMVLVEGKDKKSSYFYGLTPNYIKVKFPSDDENLKGEIVRVKIEEVYTDMAVGNLKS